MLKQYHICLCVSALQHRGMFSVTKWSTQERSHTCVIYVVEVFDSSPQKIPSLNNTYVCDNLRYNKFESILLRPTEK